MSKKTYFAPLFLQVGNNSSQCGFNILGGETSLSYGRILFFGLGLFLSAFPYLSSSFLIAGFRGSLFFLV